MGVKTFLCLCIVIFLLVGESESEQAGVDHNTFLSRNIQDTNIPSARFSRFNHRSKRHYGYGMGGMGMPYGGFGMPFGGFGMPFMGFG